MIVCHCAAVSDRRLRELVAGGAQDLLGVASACGAGSFCGGCVPVIAALFSEATGKPVSVFLQEAPTAPDDAQPLLLRKRAEAVVHEIQEDIAATGWPVGQPLGTQAELGLRYGVSQATVREALSALAHHGLVRPEGGRFLVGAPSPSRIAEAAAIHLHRVGVAAAEIDDVRRTLAGSADNPAFALLRESLARIAGEPAPAQTDAGTLARAIALDISARGLAAGQLLGAERELSARYGVGRETLREAAALLEVYAVAYPRAGPGRGLVVGSGDKWAVAQLMARYLDYVRVDPVQIAEVRHALELRSAELASANIDAEGAALLRRRLGEEITAQERTPLRARGHHNIHPLIAELSGNRILALFMSALILALLRRVPADAPAELRSSRQEAVAAVHAEIVDAITAGDGLRARRLMVGHLRQDSSFSPPDPP